MANINAMGGESASYNLDGLDPAEKKAIGVHLLLPFLAEIEKDLLGEADRHRAEGNGAETSMFMSLAEAIRGMRDGVSKEEPTDLYSALTDVQALLDKADFEGMFHLIHKLHLYREAVHTSLSERKAPANLQTVEPTHPSVTTRLAKNSLGHIIPPALVGALPAGTRMLMAELELSMPDELKAYAALTPVIWGVLIGVYSFLLVSAMQPLWRKSTAAGEAVHTLANNATTFASVHPEAISATARFLNEQIRGIHGDGELEGPHELALVSSGIEDPTTRGTLYDDVLSASSELREALVKGSKMKRSMVVAATYLVSFTAGFSLDQPQAGLVLAMLLSSLFGTMNNVMDEFDEPYGDKIARPTTAPFTAALGDLAAVQAYTDVRAAANQRMVTALATMRSIRTSFAGDLATGINGGKQVEFLSTGQLINEDVDSGFVLEEHQLAFRHDDSLAAQLDILTSVLSNVEELFDASDDDYQKKVANARKVLNEAIRVLKVKYARSEQAPEKSEELEIRDAVAAISGEIVGNLKDKDLENDDVHYVLKRGEGLRKLAGQTANRATDWEEGSEELLDGIHRGVIQSLTDNGEADIRGDLDRIIEEIQRTRESQGRSRIELSPAAVA